MNIKKALKLLKKGIPITHETWSKDIFIERVFVTKVHSKEKGVTSLKQITEEEIINNFQHYNSKNYLNNKWIKWEEPVDHNEVLHNKINELEQQKENIEKEINKYKCKLIQVGR